MLKTKELRSLSVEELEGKTESLKKDLMQYRFQAQTGKLEKQTTLRDVRRDIARVRTIVNEKKKSGEV